MSNLIIEAAQLAWRAHAPQKRKWSNRPGIEHPLRVAGRVMGLPGVTEEAVCAALDHDVPEDFPDFDWDGYGPFPAETLELIWWLTNPERPEVARDKRKALDRERLKEAPYWAKIIKLVDRIDNVYDMGLAPNKFKKTYAKESGLLRIALSPPSGISDEELTLFNNLSAELGYAIIDLEASIEMPEPASFQK